MYVGDLLSAPNMTTWQRPSLHNWTVDYEALCRGESIDKVGYVGLLSRVLQSRLTTKNKLVWKDCCVHKLHKYICATIL